MQFYCAEHQQALATLTEGSHRDDPYAVRRVCIELSRLVLANNALRSAMVADEKLLPTLVEAVAQHADTHALVLADCCRFLRRTISLRVPSELDIQSKITETGILKLLARGLECHPHSGMLLTEACRLVALVCFDMPFAPHADNQADINDSGLLRAICDRLRSEDVVTELEAQCGADAIAAALYENERNAEDAVDALRVLALFSRLLQRFPHSTRLIQSVAQALFQILTLQPTAQSEVLELGLLEQLVAFLEGCASDTNATTTVGNSDSSSALALWHSLKFLELAIRQNAKSSRARQQSPALHYVACMLFCRLAVSGEPPAAHKSRIEALVLCGAHEFALDVVKGCSSSGCASELHCAAAQAIRVLELIAGIEANRIRLTRLGASRAVKVVYNSPAATPQIQILCERAIAAIEGT